jgi:hypothetical protein
MFRAIVALAKPLLFPASERVRPPANDPALAAKRGD